MALSGKKALLFLSTVLALTKLRWLLLVNNEDMGQQAKCQAIHANRVLMLKLPAAVYT